jgi:hypothetical protein
VLIDVSDNTFLTDYYYASFRPNDLATRARRHGVAAHAAQVIAQRAAIENRQDAQYDDNGMMQFTLPASHLIKAACTRRCRR